MGQGSYGQPPQVDYAAASSKVSVPAILMMVVAGLAILLSLLNIVLQLLGTSFATLGGGAADERFVRMFSGGLGIVMALLGIAINGFVVFGAMKMKNLEGYPLAMAATILCMLPCSCCCVISLPVGVWSLIVLLDANVKAAFR